MRQLAWMIALAFTAAGCSGDGDAAARTGAASRSVRAAATPAAAAPGAERLLDFAERSFPQYFPGHVETRIASPFAYRYYPGPGTYVGVVIVAGTPFRVDGVYVLGGPFGDVPVYVGQLGDFVTPSVPDGSARGCHDLNLLDTEGTRIEVDYATRGPSATTSTVDIRIGALTTFEGHEARESITRTQATRPEGTAETTSRSYALRTGEDEITEFGNLDSVTGRAGGHTLVIDTKSVWDPPAVDRRYGLAVGQTIGIEYKGTTTQTMFVDAVRQPTEISTSSDRWTVTFVGRESVTVPAGTFQTCRFENVYGPGNTETEWVLEGVGVPVKLLSVSGADTEVTEALRVSIDGRAR